MAETAAQAWRVHCLEWLAGVATFLLRFKTLLPATSWVMARLFGRLSFSPYLCGRSSASRAQFARSLARIVQRGLCRGEIAPRFLRGWVAALLAQAWAGPRRRSAAARRGLKAPAFAIIAPSSACNLRCAHCYAARELAPTSRLSFGLVDAMVSELERAGTNLVIVSGGEPLLWREQGHDIFGLAERHPLMLFVVYSNATLLDESMARRMAHAGNLLPLLSVEGLREQTDAVRGLGVYDAVTSAMTRLKQAGVMFGVSVTASRVNAEAVGSGQFMRQLLDERGASFLWVLELASLGRAPGGWELSDSSRENLQRHLSRVRDDGRLIVSFLETNSAESGCFGAGRFDGFFYLDWQGAVRRCVYQPELFVAAQAVLEESADPAAQARLVLAASQALPACPLQSRFAPGSA